MTPEQELSQGLADKLALVTAYPELTTLAAELEQMFGGKAAGKVANIIRAINAYYAVLERIARAKEAIAARTPPGAA